jgi:large conductance mechanosensitive channel
VKKLLHEFKEFIQRGNAINLAVGVLIGAAFQAIVRSLTDDILSPVVGLFANSNLDALTLNVLGAEIRYGAFLTAIINFIVMAFVVFLIVKSVNKLFALIPKPQNSDTDSSADKKQCPFCLTELPLAATRCPACTSMLDNTPEP